jgi:hypothetical protein
VELLAAASEMAEPGGIYSGHYSASFAFLDSSRLVVRGGKTHSLEKEMEMGREGR